MKNTNEKEIKIINVNEPRKQPAPINQLKIDVPKRLKATNLFACAGLCEYYLSDIGVDVVLSNELEPERALLNHSIFPNSTMVIGDITSKEVQDKMAEIANREQCKILMMSPKCQQFTKANTHKDPNSSELFLFEAGLEHLDRVPYYEYLVIENAEEFKNCHLDRYNDLSVSEHIKQECINRGFNYFDVAVQNAKDFNTAMNRPRTIIIAAKNKTVKLPEPITKTPLTLEDVIGDLPILESNQSGKHWADVVGYIPDYQREQVEITKTGKRVDNPLTKSGNISNAIHKGAFSRAEWDKPMNSVLTNNGDLSAYHMIHPGYRIVDKTGKPILNKDGKERFTDCRPFTIHEIFRALRLPDDIRIPNWAKPKTALIRTIIGECWAPLHSQAVIAEIVKAEFGIK